MIRQRKTLLFVLVIPISIYLFVSYIFPLYSIITQTLTIEQKDFSVNMPLLIKTVRFTFKEALISTIVTLPIGMICAFIFSRYKFFGKRFCMSVISVPFMLPTVVVAAGMNAWLGPNGVLNVLLMRMLGMNTPPVRVMNSFGIIIFAHVFYNTSLVIRMVSNAWTLIDKNIIRAAETLGAKSKDVFCKIILPLIRPSIISSALLVFLFDFTSYGVVMLMGGPKFRTLEVEISYQTLQVLDLKTAGVLSLIQMLITLLIVFGEHKIKRNEFRFNKIKIFDENTIKPKSVVEKALIFVVIGLVMLITVLPVISLIFRSVYVSKTDISRSGLQTGFSLIYYRNLFRNEQNSYFFVSPVKAIFFSLTNAFYCSVIAIIIGGMICMLAKRVRAWRFLNSLVLLPIGTSAVTLGLGYLIGYRRLMTSWWITPLAHSIVVLPFVIRTLQPAVEHMPVSLGQSASLLGAKPVDVVVKIEIPILRRAIINSVVFSFTISMGEFGATSFLSRPECPTLPIAIYNYLSKPGGLNYGQAMAMSTILLVISLISIFIISDD